MKWYRFLIVFLLLWLVGACTPSTDAIATPTFEIETPTLVPPTLTPIPTNIPTATFTPSPTQTSTSTPTFTPLPPTSAPVPTPDIQFSADRSYIKVGMCVVFAWEVKNSKAVYFYAEGESWAGKIVSPHDSREECRKESTMYHLRVIGFDDAVEIREIHIPVESLPGL